MSNNIYLLSVGEACNPEYGFALAYQEESNTRYVTNTEYAKAKGTATDGIDTSSNSNSKTYGNGQWVLRSIWYQGRCAAYVGYDGHVNDAGREVTFLGQGIRPVIHVKLSSNLWTYAGTVTSAGAVNEPSSLPSETVTPLVTVTNENGLSKVGVPAIKKIKSRKKAAKIFYKKIGNVNGYEIQYSKTKKVC